MSNNPIIQAALEALERGYVAIPIRKGSKSPVWSDWTHTTWETSFPDELIARFAETIEDTGGLGLLLGEPSGGLIDVDQPDA